MILDTLTLHHVEVVFLGVQTIAIVLASLVFGSLRLLNPDYKVYKFGSPRYDEKSDKTSLSINIKNLGYGIGQIEDIRLYRAFILEDLAEIKTINDGSIEHSDDSKRIFPNQSSSFKIQIDGDIHNLLTCAEIEFVDEKAGTILERIPVFENHSSNKSWEELSQLENE